MTDKGTSCFEFDYVDSDSDDEFDVDGPLSVREKAQARVDLPIMGWVKLCAAGYGEDPGFLAVSDWTGCWLVGSSSWVSRMEYGFKKASATSQAKKILALLQPREHVIKLMIRVPIMFELKKFWWMINDEMEKSLVREFIDELVHRIGSVIMKYELKHAIKESVLQIDLMKMEHRLSVVMEKSMEEWRPSSKMEHGLRDIIEKFLLEVESIMQRDVIREWKLELMWWISTGDWPSYLLEKSAWEIEQVSLMKVARGLTDVLEKSVPEIVLIMQMEMEHGFRDVIEKSVLELMDPIKMEHVLGDVQIYSVPQMESMIRNIMDLGVWNVIQNLVPEIEPTSQLEIEHRHRDTIEYVKPEIEFLKQMTRVLHGELSDIKRGLEWALGRGLLKVIVESDSEDTIRCLVDGVGSDHPCSSLVKECRQLLRKAEEVCLRHVPLKPNQVVKYFTHLPDQRGELGKILRDFYGVV